MSLGLALQRGDPGIRGVHLGEQRGGVRGRDAAHVHPGRTASEQEQEQRPGTPVHGQRKARNLGKTQGFEGGMTFEELSHYLRLGGATLAVILAASVLAIGVAVERWIALWNISANSRALTDAVGRHLLRGDISAAKGTVDRSDTLLADVYRVAFERLERSRTVTPGVEAAVDRERAQLGLRMKKNLWILGTIGATTPFVGLFGTVAGIMRSFRELGLDVEAGGTGGTAAVMTGISEALV